MGPASLRPAKPRQESPHRANTLRGNRPPGNIHQRNHQPASILRANHHPDSTLPDSRHLASTLRDNRRRTNILPGKRPPGNIHRGHRQPASTLLVHRRPDSTLLGRRRLASTLRDNRPQANILPANHRPGSIHPGHRPRGSTLPDRLNTPHRLRHRLHSPVPIPVIRIVHGVRRRSGPSAVRTIASVVLRTQGPATGTRLMTPVCERRRPTAVSHGRSSPASVNRRTRTARATNGTAAVRVAGACRASRARV
jgi:hypothetical protein